MAAAFFLNISVDNASDDEAACTNQFEALTRTQTATFRLGDCFRTRKDFHVQARIAIVNLHHLERMDYTFASGIDFNFFKRRHRVLGNY